MVGQGEGGGGASSELEVSGEHACRIRSRAWVKERVGDVDVDIDNRCSSGARGWRVRSSLICQCFLLAMTDR